MTSGHLSDGVAYSTMPMTCLEFQGNPLSWSIYFTVMHLPKYPSLHRSQKVTLTVPNKSFELIFFDGVFLKLSPIQGFEGLCLYFLTYV